MVKRKLQLGTSSTAVDASDDAESVTAVKPVKRKKVVASDFKPVDPAILPENTKLDLADAEMYYVKNFLCDESTAKRWYEELVELDTCLSDPRVRR